MYKIMLADDEGIVIDALSFIIQKNFGDSCMIESAKTGRSVIELAERFRPDIAFMDIQMPGINGIEAMKEIKQTCHNTVFIILSAYDRFDYAKQALGMGALDYINKPIEKNVIIDILRKAMKEVDVSREKRSNDLLIREKLETVIPIIESGLIYSVLFQDNYAEDTERYKQLLGVEEEQGYMMVIKCGDDQENGHLTNTVGTSVRVQSSYQEIREIIKEFFTGIVGPMMANMIIVYVPVGIEESSEEYDSRIEVIENARKMVRKLSGRIDAKFRVGIGSVMLLEKAGVSYSEAINSFRISSGSVAHVKDLPIGCDYEENYPVQTEKKLFSFVEEGNLEGATAQATSFFNWMLESNAENVMDIKLKVLEFVLWAEKIGYESGGMVYRFSSRHDYLKSINDMSNYEEIRTWFITKIQDVCRNIVNKKEEQATKLIAIAKDYIDHNYQNEVSLDETSRQINISPYYFSKLFKEEMGQSFIEYVTGIRMEKAKELLSKTDKSMKEICNEIGYADPNYFSRTFKKNVGFTPTEFKEKREENA